MNRTVLIQNCRELLRAKETGLLGDCTMPEDTNPGFSEHDTEQGLAYFTLPMALNYQRDSYSLWKAAKKTFEDPETADVFSISRAANMPIEELRYKLLKHKLALQLNKHTDTWRKIATTINQNWSSVENFVASTDYNFLKLREVVQQTHKKGFPYLSGPKIFNYWSCIIQEYAGVILSHSEEISIAPDTHIIQCSVRLGVISPDEADRLSREEISLRWKDALMGSGITPISLHPALWFWSRGGFQYELKV